MSSCSGPLTVVVQLEEGTGPGTDFDPEYVVLEIQGNKKRGAYAWSEVEWCKDHLGGHGTHGTELLVALFGDDKLPEELAQARKFSVTGRLEGFMSGSYDCQDYDEVFEVENVQILEPTP